jgi:phosphate transport system permease protein
VHGVLPRWTPLAVLAGSFAVATLVMSAFEFSLYGIGVLGYLLTLVVLTVLSRRVEGKRKGTDRMVTTLVYGTFGLAMLPLISSVWTVLHRGLPRHQRRVLHLHHARRTR